MSKLILVAEVSANHLGSFEKAVELVRAIGSTGVSHIKFQTYTADTMTIDHDGAAFRISADHVLWGGRNLYSLYSEAYTPWEWHAELFRLSRALGMVPFSTPFDTSAVDFLEDFEPELYKIASMEIGDLPLIRRVAETQKPMIVSTGTASLSEVDEAVEAARGAGCDELTLLLCTSSYPAPPGDVHLARLDVLRDRYGVDVGLSDHTEGIAASITAVALGATVIERHVTLDRADGGPDAAFSLEPVELATLVREANAAAQVVGEPEWVSIESENESKRLKRSLYLIRDCQAGDTLTNENVRSIRPAGGLPPKYMEQILGRRLTRAVHRGSPLSLDMIEGSRDLAPLESKYP